MRESLEIRSLFELALIEDCSSDDVTAALLDPKNTTAQVIARQAGVFSGEAVVEATAQKFSGRLTFELRTKEGKRFEQSEPLLAIRGDVRTILSVERTLLNFLGHACGVASLTSQFVDAVQPHPVRILATRKTLPGLRALELRAVVAGGGLVHRRSLRDGVLIKENHLQYAKESTLIQKAREQRSPLHKIEIEVQSMEQLDRVLQNPPDVVMLDNFSVSDIEQAVRKIDGRCVIEVSGGMNLQTVKQVAPLGVQFISVGQITHSAPWHNLSMDFMP